MPDPPTKQDRVFDGWYLDKDIWQRPVTSDSFLHEKLTSDLSVYAKWREEGITQRNYTVTFNSMNGSAVEAATVTYRSEFSFAVPQRTGYAFNGWKTSDGTLLTDGEGKGKDVWNIAADTELIADWALNEYTIAYHDAENAVNTNETAYTVEDGKIVLTDASKTGYTFLGWFEAQDGGTKVTEIDTGKAENIELWARWTVTKYTIAYQDEKGAENPNKTEYTIEDDTYYLQNLSARGFTFTGWYENGEPIEKIEKGEYGNRTFTANWIAYALKGIVCNENKKAVSIFDEIDAALFEASCLDTDGQNVPVKATYSGEWKAGATITVTLTAEADGAAPLQKTLADIKVYGMPVLAHAPEAVFTTTDLTASSAEFGVVDSFGEELLFKIEVEGTVECNEAVSVTVTATDEAGNVFTETRKYTVQHRWKEGVCLDCQAEHEAHTFDEYTESTEDGHTGTCSVCGKSVTGEHTYAKGTCTECRYAHKNHTYGDGDACSVCGAKRVYTKSADGKTIYFGEYPQTEVKESDLKAMLGMEAGANPTSSDAGKWTDYGYYIEGSVQSFMWYIDVEYQENRYRGVYFTSYRPYRVTYSSTTENSYQDDNGYDLNTVYWFKYEPIRWRVLEEKDDVAFLMANVSLDSQQYYHDLNDRDGAIHPNNYKESDIRKWLNGTFYETAFDRSAQEIIETTTVDNSAASTASNSNAYVCENTQDKVFLLSYKDAVNTSYGFRSDDSVWDGARRIQSTAYAKSQGINVYTSGTFNGNSRWLLRSPASDDSNYVSSGGEMGHAYASGLYVTNTRFGVIPALRIRL